MRAAAGVALQGGRWAERRSKSRLRVAAGAAADPPARPLPLLRPRFAALQLQQGEHSQAYALLELFAYGTWDDYKGGWDGRKGQLPCV